MSTFEPRASHCAGPPQYLNGGILAAILDCHCVCTATAAAYRAERRPIGSDPHIWYVTAKLEVSYLRPTPIAKPVELVATIAEFGPKQTVLSCSAMSGGVECARAEVTAVRVPAEWFEGRRSDAPDTVREARDV
ncbi:MAG: PaaI family thioesterase [Candidatus Eiseniibacteriota bacterium]